MTHQPPPEDPWQLPGPSAPAPYPGAPPAATPYPQAYPPPYPPGAPYPSPYPPQPYAPPYGYPLPHQAAGTNGFAVASLLLGALWVFWIGSLLAVVFGFVALSQIRHGRGMGRGLAIAGLVLGFIGIATFVVLVVAGLMVGATDSTGSSTVLLFT